MASICEDANGRKRIQFIGADGKRRAVRIGKATMRQAEAFKVKIEGLVSRKITGAVDDEVSRWLAERDDATYKKLVSVGLAPSRAPREASGVVKLGPFIDGYLAGRTDIKKSTQICLGQARRNLVAFFGENKPLVDISEGDAEEYWRYLIGKLSVNTARRMAGRAKQIFRFAIRKRIITTGNPFADLKTNVKGSADDRIFFVTQEMAVKVLAACPDAEWRLIFALSRYGGLRCPSEHLSLKWTDVDFDAGRICVPSPKTEHIEGHESRMLPMFPELRKALMEAFEQAPEGAVYVIDRYRDPTMNLRTQFQRILKRAALSPWPKLFHNLRATRETERANTFPIHVVCAWIGNDPKIAKAHYLQVTDAHFELAGKAAHNQAQQPSEVTGNDRKAGGLKTSKTPENAEKPSKTAGMQVASIGLEPILLLGNGF